MIDATARSIAPGDRCRNGALVLLSEPRAATRDGEIVILAFRQDGSAEPYVTWRAWRDDETGALECVSGTYYRDPIDAAEGFARRARP